MTKTENFSILNIAWVDGEKEKAPKNLTMETIKDKVLRSLNHDESQAMCYIFWLLVYFSSFPLPCASVDENFHKLLILSLRFLPSSDVLDAKQFSAWIRAFRMSKTRYCRMWATKYSETRKSIKSN